MSNFTYVLMAGVALFVVGGMIAGMSDGPAVEVENGDGDGSDALFHADLGVIGDINSTSRTIRIGDTSVEYRSPNTTVEELDEVRISKGAFSEAQTELIRFEAREPVNARLSFAVAGARTAGEFAVIVNGDRQHSMTLEAGREYDLELTNLSEGSNTVLLTAEGPGLRLWTSTEYTLQDLSLTVTDDAVRRNLNTFRLYEYEVDGFDTGTITFAVDESPTRTAPLNIDINGNEVYEGSPVMRNLPYESSFQAATHGLRPGENTLSFYTEPGAAYELSNVVMDIQFYANTRQRTVTESFDIGEVAYRLMDEEDGGVISFNIERIGVSGDITISLPNDEFTVTPETGGEQTITFDRSAINKGSNEISITTSGTYEITDFTVDTAD